MSLTVSFTITLPALSFALPDFLFAFLTKMSLVGGFFRGVSPLASVCLSDNSVPRMFFSTTSYVDTLNIGIFTVNWIAQD